ncbi:MAG: 23S rRNA (adenine(2503)-C(2))-methyltransferase RlmN [Syntrophomonadaceae bacterium]|nr:23S rRNA (adenine(2503)-C(2))-methyltransferase RlmN [Syntrophomonadaceae bacterium]
MKTLGEPGYRGKQIYHWIYRRDASSIEEMTDLPGSLRQLLQQKAWVGIPRVIRRQLANDDLTVKLLLEMEDGQRVEAVLMPYSLERSRDRLTFCLSSQVGCPLGCAFCATGQAGFVRNLDAGEIVGQVLALRREVSEPGEGINIVFMGMGEPLLNYSEIIKSLNLLHAPEGIKVGYRRITVSTAGVVPGIYRLAKEGLPVNLAVSLHASNNVLRNQLVPLNRRYPLEELLPACREYFTLTRRRVTFEYILLKAVNDSIYHAEELGRLLKGMPVLVNLIPVNPTEGGFKRPSSEQIQLFIRTLRQLGMEVTLREERGGQISAACGQLRGQLEAKR